MTALGFICANWGPERTDCQKEGRFTCKNCRLILYCGSICQKSHWSHHKPECRSTLGKVTWQPDWVLESRTPAFIGGDLIGQQPFGQQKYLWGNMPAIDILQLGSNEGEDYAGNLRVLLAASGDLRNVVQTVARVPSNYNHSLEITINDRDLDIVARNIILLLIALVVEDTNEAIDCVIHIWYSALVRESDMDILQSRIRPLIEDVCQKVKDKASKRLLAKTWTFGQRSLRVVLEKSSWDRLLSFVNNPPGLTAEQAHKVRAATTMAESRRDYRDRQTYCLSPLRRIALTKFRQDGLLLPFGFPRHEFQIPNPTFFHTADTWPLKDNADPLGGWSSEDVAATSSGPATADINGKLFYYLRTLLRSFLDRLSSLNVSFKMFQVDASSLPGHLDSDTFSRIEVSNISDAGWLGIHRTLYYMMPLLQTPPENPHATLITLFMNAVDETLTEDDMRRDLTANSQNTKRVFKYLPKSGNPRSPYDPILIKFNLGRDLVRTYDHIFDRYFKKFKFREAADFAGAAVKEKHTIIDKWPYRLKLRPGQPGAQVEFDRLMSEGLSGKERYMEWKKL